MDCRASFEDIESYRPYGSREYFLQLNNIGPPELVIEWTEANFLPSQFSYFYSGIKIIDFENLDCLVDIISSETTEVRGGIDINGNSKSSESASITKHVEVGKGFINIGKLIYEASDSSVEISSNINNLKPGHYRFTEGKFRLFK